MDKRYIKHGTHVINDDTDGYMYSFNISKSYNFGSHLHKCYEFLHIISGELIYTAEDNEYVLTDGDMIMTKPAEFHSFGFTKECEYQREFLHIYPEFFKDYPSLVDMLENRPTGKINRISAELMKKYKIDVIFCNMRDCCRHPFPETDALMSAYSAELVLMINRVLRDEEIIPQTKVWTVKTDTIRYYIDRHYREDISIDDIASAMHMSTGNMIRTFKRETGMTPKAYMNMRRITHAKNLIMEGQKASAVYLSCGFKDYSSFYRAFVKYTEMTPDEFRRFHSKIGGK